MKTLKSFVKLIRKQKILIRIIAIFKFLFIFFVFWYGLEAMAGTRVLDSLDIALSIGVPSIIGFIGSIGLWLVTTNIMRYKWPILILYIPGLYFATIAAITPCVMFFNPLYPPQILKTSVSIFAVFTEILLLICFWQNADSFKINHKQES